MGREMAEAMARPGDMLFGRRTWQDFSTAWGRLTDGNPVTTHMNAATKYVVSKTLQERADAWQNSILLRGDAAATVAGLKAQPGRDLSIIGSASLVRSLHAAALIAHTLLIHPLTLGSGTRLFDGPAPLTEFDLTGSTTTSRVSSSRTTPAGKAGTMPHTGAESKNRAVPGASVPLRAR